MGAFTFTDADVRDLAGPRSYERGLGYVDAVGRLRAENGCITAMVRGTDLYRVVLHATGPLSAACDCPYGEDGFFCKHCVAVALTVLRDPGRQSALHEEAVARDAALDTWLGSLGRDELLALVRERLTQDEGFKETLTLRASTAGGDTAAVRSAIRVLTDPGDFSQYGYIGYEDAAGYAAQLERAALALGDLTAVGQADAAIEAARDAIGRIAAVYDSADDSDGEISQAAAALVDAHLEACAVGAPDPDETARWIVEHCLDESRECIEVVPAAYADVLGKRGLSTLRALAEEALSRNPSGWAEGYLMESLARAEGDLDALIATYAADLLPDGATHLRIAGELDAADRTGEALMWAENGLRHAASAQEPPHSGLVAYVAECYAREGRTADALTVRRDHFRTHPTLAAYRELRAAAQAQGSWDAERPHALEVLRKGAGNGPVLIDVLIDDGDLDASWAAAPEHTHPGQWLKLADASVTSRPAEALNVYLTAVEARKQHTGNSVYRDIADLLTKARSCHEALGTLDAFTTYVTALRTEHKRRRNLIRLLDQQGL